MIAPFNPKAYKPYREKPVNKVVRPVAMKTNRPAVNDENCNSSNLIGVISMSKKIKRQPEVQPPLRNLRHILLKRKGRPYPQQFVCYRESYLQLGPLADMMISHRMDNDCESDDEQVQAGIKKMFYALQYRVNELRKPYLLTPLN